MRSLIRAVLFCYSLLLVAAFYYPLIFRFARYEPLPVKLLFKESVTIDVRV